MTEKSLKGGDLSRGERLQIMLASEELEIIEDFRFKWRLPSRAATVRELLRRGLAAEGNVGVKDRNSHDFGVTDNNADGTLAGDAALNS